MPALSSDPLLHCQALHAQGRHAEALALANATLAGGNDDFGRWRCLMAIGNIQRSMEDFTASLAAHGEALNMARAAGNPVHVAMAWNNLGCTFLGASCFDLAVECFARITEDPELVAAWPPYYALQNMALCHLYLDVLPDGVACARRAIALETPDLVKLNPHAPVNVRYMLVQLGLQGDTVPAADIRTATIEAEAWLQHAPDRRSAILVALCNAGMELLWGDHNAGMAQIRAQLEEARELPHVLPEVLFALVKGEILAGRPEQAMVHLGEWATHVYHDGPRQAKLLAVGGFLAPGATLREQMAELMPAMRLALPPSIRALLEAA